MLTVYCESHRQHLPRGELYGGRLVPPFENPARMDYVLERLDEVKLGEVIAPESHAMAPILAVHDAGFVHFLETCWDEWTAAEFEGDALPTVWPARGMRQREPDSIDGKLGYFALAAETAITAGTWPAARASVDVALSAQSRVAAGARAVFALCRPPGHHAARDLYGGYCFLNNAAIAAQAFLDGGASRVAILDVDFHHGNGTQEIFYARADVLYASLHGDPRHAFPHFLGYADETGRAAGEGCNANYPMPPGTGFEVWGEALADACRRITAYRPDAVVVSLGVDAFKDDPISFFKLESDDYCRVGERVAALGLPTLFVMEGGYAVAEIGINTVNVLSAFEQA